MNLSLISIRKKKKKTKVLRLEDSRSHLLFFPIKIFCTDHQNLMHHTCYTVLNIRLSICHFSVGAERDE